MLMDIDRETLEGIELNRIADERLASGERVVKAHFVNGELVFEDDDGPTIQPPASDPSPATRARK